MLRFAADEDFNRNIVKGLRERNPLIDIATVQERQLQGLPDAQVLEWAAGEQRILLSHDTSTMSAPAYERVALGQPMPGVILVRKATSIGRAIDALELLAGASSEDEWANLVEYLPRL